MSYITTVYPKSVAWNSLTWDDGVVGTGGLERIVVNHTGVDVSDRAGTQEYPMFVQIVNKAMMISVILREVKQITALGTKSNMTITLSGKGGTPTLTCVGLLLRSVNMGQGRAEPGETSLDFVHESADGVTVPVS